ncbi:MAG: hypothetical protein BWX46_00662 [Candidatus Cloacimonetes bacterium ADurb.Bin003]|nr:MAG: hypothetical protein BWX46_00662 [Candidatus Cloacimonetes bacterium ADurb.Bin003]
MCLASTGAVFKNFLLAGRSLNNPRTVTAVPMLAEVLVTLFNLPLAYSTIVAISSSAVLVTKCNLETEAIEGNASPLKPREPIWVISSTVFILLVEWRSKASIASSAFIPQPLSITLIRSLPPFSIATIILSAPASIAFSTSSLTTEAGRSITSPAAILLRTSSAKIWILDT